MHNDLPNGGNNRVAVGRLSLESVDANDFDAQELLNTWNSEDTQDTFSNDYSDSNLHVQGALTEKQFKRQKREVDLCHGSIQSTMSSGHSFSAYPQQLHSEQQNRLTGFYGSNQPQYLNPTFCSSNLNDYSTDRDWTNSTHTRFHGQDAYSLSANSILPQLAFQPNPHQTSQQLNRLLDLPPGHDNVFKWQKPSSPNNINAMQKYNQEHVTEYGIAPYFNNQFAPNSFPVSQLEPPVQHNPHSTSQNRAVFSSLYREIQLIPLETLDKEYLGLHSRDRYCMLDALTNGLINIQSVGNQLPLSLASSITEVASQLELLIIRGSSDAIAYKKHMDPKFLMDWLLHLQQAMDYDGLQHHQNETAQLPLQSSFIENLQGQVNSASLASSHTTRQNLLYNYNAIPNSLNHDSYLNSHIFAENMLPPKQGRLASNMLPDKRITSSSVQVAGSLLPTSNVSAPFNSCELNSRPLKKPTCNQMLSYGGSTTCIQTPSLRNNEICLSNFKFSLRPAYSGDFLVVINSNENVHVCRRTFIDITRIAYAFNIPIVNQSLVSIDDPDTLKTYENMLRDISQVPYAFLHPEFCRFFDLNFLKKIIRNPSSGASLTGLSREATDILHSKLDEK